MASDILKHDMEQEITRYIRDELNKNSLDIIFELGFWASYTEDGENLTKIQVDDVYSKEVRVVPLTIEIYDGEILPIEGLINLTYTTPLTFQIYSEDKEFMIDVINSINDFKNKHKNKLHRFEFNTENGKEYLTATIATDNLTPYGNMDIQMGKDYIFGTLNVFFDISKDISYGNQVEVYLKVPDYETTYFWSPTIEQEDFDFEQDEEPTITNEGQIWRKSTGIEKTLTTTFFEPDVYDKTVTDYSTSSAEEAIMMFTSEYDWQSEPDGTVIRVQYNTGYFYATVVYGDEQFEYYVSKIEGDIDISEYTRIYPIAPALMRNNIQENIQNFEKSEAENILQESDFTITFNLIVKEDNLHYKILEDLINKLKLNTVYTIKMVWKWYNGKKELEEKIVFEKNVIIISGNVMFGIGEEQVIVLSLGKYLETEDLSI